MMNFNKRRALRYCFLAASLFFITGTLKCQQREQVLLTGFGAKADSYQNASPALKQALDLCAKKQNATLVLPGGRIDLWPDGAFKRELYISNATENDTLSKVKNIGFLINGFKNLVIEGNNTLVVLHGKMVSFAIINSENITIRNLQFDYERPTMSELTVTNVTDTSAQVTIHRDSRYLINNGRIGFYGEGWKSNSYHTILFDTSQHIMRYSSFKAFEQALATEQRPYQINFSGNFSKRNFQAGNVLTVRDPYRDNCGALIWLSKNILLQNCKMYYMHGLGIVSQFSENIRFLKVQVAPRENSGRIISSFADCFHFSGCKGNIIIDSCFTSGSHDDPVNVHGTHLKIVSVGADKKLIVRFMHHQTYGFEAFFANDSIAFVNPQTLQLFGYAKLKNAKLINKREMELEVDGSFARKSENR